MRTFKNRACHETLLKRTGDRFLSALVMPALLVCLSAPLRSADMTGENSEDAAISTEVKTALLHQLSFNFLVRTNEGVVTLSGSATDTAERDLNSRIAAGINGVKRVINDMTLPAAVARND